MFGGQSSTAPFLDDTWEWNGTAWSNVTPASGNAALRRDHALAYDPARDVVVMFGGIYTNSAVRADTWEWDGSTWTQKTPLTNNPPSRYQHAMTYDAARGRVVAYAGASSGSLGDVWEWNGTAWNAVAAGGSPDARLGHSLSYDAARGQSVMFGGTTDGVAGDTWLYRFSGVDQPEGCLYGFDGDGDSLVGCADPDCAGYCAPVCNPDLSTCPAAAPRCGDGMCQPIETKRLCPSDCGAPAAVCGDFLCDSSEAAATCPGDCP